MQPSTQPSPPSPLSGVAIWVTRPEPEAARLCASLAERGAIAIAAPLLSIVPVPVADLLSILRDVAAAQAVLVTSANSAHFLGGQWSVQPQCANAVWYCFGEATQRALQQYELPVRRPADVHTANGLATWLAPQLAQSGATIVWPHGNLANPAPAQLLQDAGWEVVRRVCYHTQNTDWPESDWQWFLRQSQLKLAVFFSPSAVHRQANGMGFTWPSDLLCVCVGLSTATACRQSGGHVAGVASYPSSAAVSQTLERVVTAWRAANIEG